MRKQILSLALGLAAAGFGIAPAFADATSNAINFDKAELDFGVTAKASQTKFTAAKVSLEINANQLTENNTITVNIPVTSKTSANTNYQAEIVGITPPAWLNVKGEATTGVSTRIGDEIVMAYTFKLNPEVARAAAINSNKLEALVTIKVTGTKQVESSSQLSF